MKKILFGSAAAICGVVGFSSFRNTNLAIKTYYVFDAKAGQSAPLGCNKPFTNTMVQGLFLATIVLNTNVCQFFMASCNGNTVWCAAAFTRNQIVTDNPASGLSVKWKLVTSAIILSQPNEHFAAKG